MEHAETSTQTGHDAHDAGHGEEFYEQTNPKFFGLPLGVVIATSIAVIAVGITVAKFMGGWIQHLH